MMRELKFNRNYLEFGKRFPVMLPLFGLFTACLTVTVSCNKDESRSVVQADAAWENPAVHSNVAQEPIANTSPVESSRENVSQDESSEFELQELEQLSSPFTKETVLELNAIVARSLATIEEFDDARRQTGGDDDVSSQMETYSELSTKAKQARADMDVAGKRLHDNGEEYNKAIFAAMVRFVNDVDKEIRTEISDLHKNP